MATLTKICLLLLVIVASLSAQCQAESSEVQLMHDMLDKYTEAQRLSRPVTEHSDTVNVAHSLMLMTIKEVDDEKRTASIQVWPQMSWTDEILKWDPAKYGGVAKLHIPIEKIWKPDILAFTGSYRVDEALAVAFNTGLIYYIPPSHMTLPCTSDAMDTDTVSCTIKFGSWTYDAEELNLDEPSWNTEFMVKNPDFVVVNTSAERHEKHYDCCPEAYVDVTYTIEIKRVQST